MTIAVGQICTYGSIKCALVASDSRVVATDLATTSGSKMHLSIGFDEGTIKSCSAIANASEDGRAATMLASDITSALADDDVKDIPQALTEVKRVMTEWHSAYGSGRPPSMEFVLGIGGIGGHSGLFYCSPPNTIAQHLGRFAIGQGSRVVDPLLPPESGSDDLPSVEVAIVRAAYWIYRAKRDEGAYCGGCANIVVVSEKGGFAFIEKTESEAAEAIGGEIDDILQWCRYGVLGRKSPQEQEHILKTLNENYARTADKIRALEFSTLHGLAGIVGVKKSKGGN